MTRSGGKLEQGNLPYPPNVTRVYIALEKGNQGVRFYGKLGRGPELSVGSVVRGSKVF